MCVGTYLFMGWGKKWFSSFNSTTIYPKRTLGPLNNKCERCYSNGHVFAGNVLRCELSSLELDMLSSRLVLNNTGRAEDQDLLVFNRVPKVGSQTMHNLISRLGLRNNFTSYKDDDENVRARGETTMVSLDCI